MLSVAHLKRCVGGGAGSRRPGKVVEAANQALLQHSAARPYALSRADRLSHLTCPGAPPPPPPLQL